MAELPDTSPAAQALSDSVRRDLLLCGHRVPILRVERHRACPFAVDFMAVEQRQALGVLTESERRERGGQAGRVPDFTGLAMSASQDEDRR
jgi:hypothetical protein